MQIILSGSLSSTSRASITEQIIAISFIARPGAHPKPRFLFDWMPLARFTRVNTAYLGSGFGKL
jgi:hypothetical protein